MIFIVDDFVQLVLVVLQPKLVCLDLTNGGKRLPEHKHFHILTFKFNAKMIQMAIIKFKMR